MGPAPGAVADRFGPLPPEIPGRHSAIVPTIGRPDELRRLIAALRQQTVALHELVVVDAGPLDNAIEQVCAEALAGSEIELRYGRSEPGTSLQRNVALTLATGEFLFLFDDDLVPEPDFVERCLEAFALPFSPPVGCVLGTFSGAGRGGGGLRKRWFATFGMTHADEGNEAFMYPSGGVRWAQRPSRVVEVPAASGGRTAFRRACFETERFAEYLPGRTQNEDVEVSYRIAHSWTIVQSPDVVCRHDRVERGRPRYGDSVARIIYANFYFFRQHRPKDPHHLGAFAWSNLGTVGYYGAVGLSRGDARDVLRGIARGYRWCARDLRGQPIMDPS